MPDDLWDSLENLLDTLYDTIKVEIFKILVVYPEVSESDLKEIYAKKNTDYKKNDPRNTFNRVFSSMLKDKYIEKKKDMLKITVNGFTHALDLVADFSDKWKTYRV